MKTQLDLFPPDALPLPRRLFSVSQMAKRLPGMSRTAIRHLVDARHSNGLTSAVIQVGRRILVDEEKFHNWLDNQTSRAAE